MLTLKSCSIAYGVIAGVLSYILINGIAWSLDKVSGGRISPPNYDESEPWVIPPGGIVPIWMFVFFNSSLSPQFLAHFTGKGLRGRTRQPPQAKTSQVQEENRRALTRTTPRQPVGNVRGGDSEKQED